MIVGLEFGFYVPALIPVEHRTPGDDRILQVRTRRAVDLDRLRESYLPDLGETVVLKGGSDFQFRAYCTLEQWGLALYWASLDIDYINEKNGAKTKYHDGPLYNLFEKIWTAALTSFPRGSVYEREVMKRRR